MITISKNILDSIVDHAKSELPNEACGYLGGKDGIITRSYPLTNIDHSPEHFSFDPAEQFATIKRARIDDVAILANYHSHPASPARPSVEDIRLAYDPNILYFIISLAENNPTIKAFRIVNGDVSNEELIIK